ncbi:glycosyltransferase [Chitinophagaceae bacterium LWZ2-11]
MKPKVFLICTGAGHINRGYESFSIECFEALKNSDKVNLYFLKGSGPSNEKEIKISCLKRNNTLTKKIAKRIKKETYWIEQLTFLFGMLPSLIKHRPQVIYYSDFILGTWLWHLKRVFKFKYRLLFSNGAPNKPPFTRMDHVQQLLATYLNDAVNAGTSSNMQSLVPYGFNICREGQLINDIEKNILKKKLGLPLNKEIIISVGAVNVGQKRMNYVIDEFRGMDDGKYFLLILGQIDEQSTSILEMAKEKLRYDSYIIKTVGGNEVNDYLSVADYFILASLSEGFGRVLIEALYVGLIPIIHDYPVARDVLHENGVFKDLTKQGELALAIKEINEMNISRESLRRFAFENYSWEKLSKQYEKMIVSLTK